MLRLAALLVLARGAHLRSNVERSDGLAAVPAKVTQAAVHRVSSLSFFQEDAFNLASSSRFLLGAVSGAPMQLHGQRCCVEEVGPQRGSGRLKLARIDLSIYISI